MILDTGICTIFREQNVALPGHMPQKSWTKLGQSWYKELSFSTEPSWQTENREETRQDQRIRIHQMRCIRKEDRAVLGDVDDLPKAGVTVYKITRAYHGQDDDSPALITDLSLLEVSP